MPPSPIIQRVTRTLLTVILQNCLLTTGNIHHLIRDCNFGIRIIKFWIVNLTTHNLSLNSSADYMALYAYNHIRVSFKLINLAESQSLEREEETQKEGSSTCWFSPSVANTGSLKPVSSRPPTWLSGTQTLGPSCAVLPRSLAGIWMGSRADRTWQVRQ